MEPSMTQRWRDWLAQAEHDYEQAVSHARNVLDFVHKTLAHG